jgi:NAD(P)H-hydrate epimerase
MLPQPLQPHRALTRAESREVDRRAIEELGIPGVVLMENAGLGLTRVVLEERERRGAVGAVAIVAGRGNNGGDGFVLARQLQARGVAVELAYCAPAEDPPRGDAGLNYSPLLQTGPQPRPTPDAEALRAWLKEREADCDLLVDALYGTGLSTPLRPAGLAFVEALAASALPVVAVDLPSGLCCDTGQALGAAVPAVRTVTFVAIKRGFLEPEAAAYTGPVEVVAIGCPPAVWADLSED